MTNIALGQYYPAPSPIHRLDARMKVILATVFIVAVFLCKNVCAFGAVLAAAFLLIFISKIPISLVLRAIRPIIFIMLFTALINVFFKTGETPLFTVGKLAIYPEGIYHAVFMVVRIVALILATSLFLTYTTTPISLTDAIESLLKPLSYLRVPVHEFAMMMTIALRFIPTLSEETAKIMSAQKARGVDFGEGGLVRRAKSLVPILIPLFVSAFRRAEELAMAMECRCYRGGKGRTRMTVPHYRPRDLVALLVMAGFVAGIVLLNRYAPGYTM